MVSHIKSLEDGSRLAFGKGKFDHWCVYLQRPQKKWRAPRDREYFNALKKVAKKHGPEQVYGDFVVIYEHTQATFDKKVVRHISQLSLKYEKEAPIVDLWFTVLYAGMVAEENKKNTILKKRIKRLGMHQLLIENKTPQEAAQFSRGKEAWMLDLLCSHRGF